RVLRWVLLWRRVTFPLDEAATNGVVLLLQQHVGSRQKLAGHGVRVRKVTLRSIEDDVLQRAANGTVSQLHQERLIRFIPQAIEKGGLNCGGRLLGAPRPRRVALHMLLAAFAR